MGSIFGSVAGAQASQNQLDDARRAREQALRLFQGINVPSIADQTLSYEDLQNVGNLTPTLESTNQMGPSGYEGISLDPAYQQAQMSALEQLSQLGQTGLSPAERAALNEAHRSAAQSAQAKSAQLQDEFARRGMGGSGAELASRLQAGQSGADRQSQESDAIMKMAQERALQALGSSANLAGQMRGQQYGEKADLAKARDYINQFNTQNQQNVQQRNVNEQNQAQLRNLTNRQNMANQNVGIHNAQQEHNKGLYQQQFNNQMGRAGGMSGQYQGIAQNAQNQAGRTADMWAGIGRGVDTGVGSYLNSRNSKDNANNGFTKNEEDDYLNEGLY